MFREKGIKTRKCKRKLIQLLFVQLPSFLNKLECFHPQTFTFILVVKGAVVLSEEGGLCQVGNKWFLVINALAYCP